MSESYDKAKQLLDQLVYSSANAGSDGGIHSDVIPLEQKSLFERLQSFNPLTWFGKPPSLSAVACATKGWRNTSPDVLTCDSCGAKIWCKLPANLVSHTAAGVIRGFEQQLTDAHAEACVLRSNSSTGQGPQQLQAAVQIRFPVLPSSKLSSSYHSRLQDLRLLGFTPQLVGTAVPRLVAAAKQLHPTLPKALAALLQLPVESGQHDAQATAAEGSSATAQDTALSKQQVTAILALCGWQVQALLPPHLAKTTVARPSSAFGVSHLVPRSGSASSSKAAAAAAGSSQHSSSISAADAALCCELCGCKVGLWEFSRSGPYYMAQLASKAMSMLTAVDAVCSQQPAAAATTPSAQEHVSSAAPAADSADQLHNTIAGGPLQVTLVNQQPQQPEQQQQDQQHTVASSEAVVSSLYHTIAGGSLLHAPVSASAGVGAAALRTSPAVYSSSPGAAAAGCSSASPGFNRAASPGSPASPNAPRPGPFGAPAAPAFGTATGGGSSRGLFGLPSPAAATASVFGEAAVPAAVPGASGPFGAAPGAAPSAAPVFGLGALKEEEQRTKRRRSSSDAAAGFAAAAATRMPSLGRSMSASPGFKLPPNSSAGPSPEPWQPAAKQQKSEVAVGAAVGGGSSGGRLRSFMKQQSVLAAAAEEEFTGSAAASFDPIGQHRQWCPWVNTVSPGQGSNAATAQAIRAVGLGTDAAESSGIAAVLAVGWSSTLLAIQEQLEEEELLRGGEQQQSGDAVMQGLLGEVPKPGQFVSTAAVLAKARQMLDALGG